MEILQSNQLNIDNEDEARKVRLSSSTTVDSGIFVCQNLQSEEDSIKEQKRGNFVENSLIFSKASDLILKVDETLIPVKRMVLWENSGLFRGILASTAVVDDEGFQMLTIHGINPHDMEYILTFFDDPFRQVDELEVLETLELAHLLDCPTLIRKCECILCLTNDMHPFDLLLIAEKYGLERLEETAVYKAAMAPRIFQYCDFDELPFRIQNKITGMVINQRLEHDDVAVKLGLHLETRRSNYGQVSEKGNTSLEAGRKLLASNQGKCSKTP